MEYGNIQRDFVRRTLDIVEKYQGENDVTLLINCCLGLLVLPKEKHHSSFPNLEITKNQSFWGLTYESVNVDLSSCSYKLPDIIRKMRNGICHFKVETIPDNSGEITSLRIKDNGNFKVELSVSQLKEFITSLGNHVLSN